MLRRRSSVAIALVLVAAILSACSAGSSTGATEPPPYGSAVPGPSLAPGATFSQGDLRVLLVQRFGPRWYCDPDEYPIARPSFDETQAAIDRFADIQADAELFQAITAQLGLTGLTTFSDAQKLAIYRAWKPLVGVALEPAGPGRFTFDYVARPLGDSQTGVETTGSIDATGAIIVTATASAGPPNCPICLAVGTPIDTPAGSIPIERVRLGDTVWTLDDAGLRVPAVVIALGSMVAPATHEVIRLTLADGRTVTASPGHPLPDGRLLGALEVGATMDGSTVAAMTWLPYGLGRTYDLLVSGPTGVYLSNGIALGSTLR